MLLIDFVQPIRNVIYTKLLNATVANDCSCEESVQDEYDAVQRDATNEGEDEPDDDRYAQLRNSKNVEDDQHKFQLAIHLVRLSILFFSLEQLLLQDCLNFDAVLCTALLLQNSLSSRCY